MLSADFLRKIMPSRSSLWQPIGNDGIRLNWLTCLGLGVSGNVLFQIWALSFLPALVVSVVFQVWTLVFILMMCWLYRREGSYRLSANFWLFGMIALAGACLIIMSISPSRDSITGGGWLFGVLLMIGAVALRSLDAVLFKWSDVASQQPSSDPKSQTAWFLLVSIFSAFASGIIALTAGLIASETIAWGTAGSVWLAGSAVVLLGNIADVSGLRKASERPATIIAKYATPLFSVGYLVVIAEADDVSVTLFAFGMIAVVASNVLIAWRNNI